MSVNTCYNKDGRRRRWGTVGDTCFLLVGALGKGDAILNTPMLGRGDGHLLQGPLPIGWGGGGTTPF